MSGQFLAGFIFTRGEQVIRITKKLVDSSHDEKIMNWQDLQFITRLITEIPRVNRSSSSSSASISSSGGSSSSSASSGSSSSSGSGSRGGGGGSSGGGSSSSSGSGGGDSNRFWTFLSLYSSHIDS